MQIHRAVAINIYKEPLEQIDACLARVHEHLPGTPVGIFFNGVMRDDVYALAKSYNCSPMLGENFATNARWNLWWMRMLIFLYETRAEICFKFDPDTMVDKTPTEYPNTDYFGTVWMSRRYRIPFIQGGVTGLSRRAIGLLLSSGLLEYPSSEAVPVLQYDWDSFADDQHLAMALLKLRILPSPWKECRSRWKVPVLNESGEYAIVHPRYYFGSHIVDGLKTP